MWQASWVDFPAGYGDGQTKTIGNLSADEKLSSNKLPTIIFVHGCAGMLRGGKRRVDFFADNGYAVISPISFAREKYPRSCSILLPKRSLMYRGTLAMRQHDIAYERTNPDAGIEKRPVVSGTTAQRQLRRVS